MPEDIFEKEDAVETTTEETKPEKEEKRGKRICRLKFRQIYL